MANVYLLNVSPDAVTLGNVFSTARGYIYKNPTQYSATLSYAFTSTLQDSSLQLYQETSAGITISDYSALSRRESLGPDVPIAGPFIENYSVDGNLDTISFIAILLIDKPPIKTGYFEFYIGDISFTGFISKQIKYTKYNWERIGTKYGYVAKDEDLGYGIEISKNLLYTAIQVGDKYEYIPTELNSFLRNLSGGEEIRSTATTEDPNDYIQSIPGLPKGTSGSLPVNLFYISAADALRYIASYSDLIESFGTDYAKGQLNYVTDPRAITFNPIAYLNKYSDIRQQYGYDTYGATEHYILFGYSQGRNIDDSSTSDPLTGGLYDERTGSIALAKNLIVWPQGETIAGRGSVLTYKYNTSSFFLNGSAEMTGNLVYLGFQ